MNNCIFIFQTNYIRGNLCTLFRFKAKLATKFFI